MRKPKVEDRERKTSDGETKEAREAIKEHQKQVHQQLAKWLRARHGVSELNDVEGHPAGSEGDEGDSPEVRKPKVGRIPTAPTKRELEDHLPLHMPYKAWCPVCVAGEGIHNQSRQTPTDERERIGITVSMDFCFLTTDGEADKDPKILILHDDRLETLWALGVKSKAVTPEVVTWIMSKLEESGY